jgi:hypothetical protein
MVTIKGFPDPCRSLAFMKLSDDLEAALIPHTTLWADCVRRSLQDKNHPIVVLCKEIMHTYESNAKMVLETLGDELVNRIQKLLKP